MADWIFLLPFYRLSISSQDTMPRKTPRAFSAALVRPGTPWYALDMPERMTNTETTIFL